MHELIAKLPAEAGEECESSRAGLADAAQPRFEHPRRIGRDYAARALRHLLDPGQRKREHGHRAGRTSLL